MQKNGSTKHFVPQDANSLLGVPSFFLSTIVYVILSRKFVTIV